MTSCHVCGIDGTDEGAKQIDPGAAWDRGTGRKEKSVRHGEYHPSVEVSTSPQAEPVVNLQGAISAFERLSREASSLDQNCFAAFFMGEIANLLGDVQRGRLLTEDGWITALESARIASELLKGGPHA